MASTFSDLLRLEIQASGENDSSWGSRANTVFEMLEDAIANFKSVVLAADANYVLTTANSSTDEARCMGLNFTSGVALTATRNITVPTSTKSYFVKNGTTGGQSLQIKTAAGTGITIPNGKTSLVLCDGVNVISALDWLSSLTLGTPLALADGGTASTTASAARTALGVVIGTNVQAWDADLDALAALGSTGIAARTAANAWAQRTITAGAGIVVTNGDGVAGNPTIASRIPQNSRSANYTTTLSDADGHILHPAADNNPRTFTIDSNANVAYAIGDAITFVNEVNTLTIAITADTMTLAGSGATGSRTLGANGMATALKIGTTKWMINGTGLT